MLFRSGHIKILCNKVSKSIGIMLRVTKNVDVNVLKMLYHSLRIIACLNGMLVPNLYLLTIVY